MLLKFRQKILSWLRESDDYDDRGHYLYPDLIDAPNQPVPEYSNAPARRPRGPRNTWPPGSNIKQAKQVNGLVGSPNNEDSIDSNFRAGGIFLKLVPAHGGIVLESRQYDDRNGEWATVVHVIPESEDLATALSHIITLQSLRS